MQKLLSLKRNPTVNDNAKQHSYFAGSMSLLPT